MRRERRGGGREGNGIQQAHRNTATCAQSSGIASCGDFRLCCERAFCSSRSGRGGPSTSRSGSCLIRNHRRDCVCQGGEHLAAVVLGEAGRGVPLLPLLTLPSVSHAPHSPRCSWHAPFPLRLFSRALSRAQERLPAASLGLSPAALDGLFAPQPPVGARVPPDDPARSVACVSLASLLVLKTEDTRGTCKHGRLPAQWLAVSKTICTTNFWTWWISHMGRNLSYAPTSLFQSCETFTGVHCS